MAEYVKLEDLAKHAGVSVSTVSRALRGEKGVSQTTRQRIQRLAASTGYTSPTSSRGRGVQEPRPEAPESRMKMVVVVRMEELTRFYGDTLVELLERGQELGHGVTVLTRSRSESLAASLQAGQAEGADCIALLTWEHLGESEGRLIASFPVTTILVGRHVEGRTTAVTHDDLAAGVEAARYLIRLGHTRIAHLQGPQGSSAMRERAMGFRWALQEAGCYDPRLFLEAGSGSLMDLVPQGMDQLLSLASPPTALWIPADVHAGAAVMIARTRGLRVPDDLSVMGFDASPDWVELGLTTFDRRLRELARYVLHLAFLRVIGAVTGPARVCVTPRLVVGTTTGPAATNGVSI